MVYPHFFFIESAVVKAGLQIVHSCEEWERGFLKSLTFFTGIIWINTIASTYNRWPYLRLISRRYMGDMTGYGSIHMETAFCLVLFYFSYVLLSSLWGFPLLHPSIFFHLSNSASWWGWSYPALIGCEAGNTLDSLWVCRRGKCFIKNFNKCFLLQELILKDWLETFWYQNKNCYLWQEGSDKLTVSSGSVVNEVTSLTSCKGPSWEQ